MNDNAALPDLPAIDLAGFDPPWAASEYAWGQPVEYPASSNLAGRWKDHQYHVEVLGWAYHDYLGTHCYAQVWDYAQQDDPHQRWQYVLLLNRPTRHVNGYGAIVTSTWAWAIASEYEGCPSYATVGADIDRWVECPEILRFIIQG